MRPDYAGLPAELEALQARLPEDVEEAEAGHRLAGQSTLASLKQLSSQADRLSDGMRRDRRRRQEARRTAPNASPSAARTPRQTASPASAAAPTALVGGIDRLSGGAEALETALAEGFERVGPAAERAAPGQRPGARRQAPGSRARPAACSRATPGLFDSGYFVLSALDGAPPRNARSGRHDDRPAPGGQAASMLVISRYSFNTPGLDRAQQAARRRRRRTRPRKPA